MKYWIVTFHPAPLMGGNPQTVIGRMLACTETSDPPTFELTLAAGISVDLLDYDLKLGITSSLDRAWPNDDMRALAETKPDWTAEGLKVWKIPATPESGAI